MYQLPHYSDALRQFPSAALSAYFATGGGNTNSGNSTANNGSHHPLAAAAAAAAAVASHHNPFSIDNILASRPRLPVHLSPYYGSTSANVAQVAADFYCKYSEIDFFFFFLLPYLKSSMNSKGVRPKSYDIYILSRIFVLYICLY